MRFFASRYRRMLPLLGGAMLGASLCLPAAAADSAKQPARKAPAADMLKPEQTPIGAPATELTPQILYQFMLAEVAGMRGQIPFAVAAYLDLAKTTRNAAIAKRATEVAVHARQFDSALEASRIWVEQEPDSMAARQTLVTLLAAYGRNEEVATQMARALEMDKEHLPENLLRLNRMFARVSDKVEVQHVIEQVTAPYLDLPEAHFARAQAAYTARDVDGAQREIEQAITQRPNWEQAVLFKALLVQQQPAQVIDTLTPFVRNNPQAIDARLALARALVSEKRFSDARAQFQAVLDQQPDNADTMYATGLLSLQIKDYATADKLFRKLIDDHYVEEALLRTYLGQIAEETGKPLDAIGWYASVGPGPQYIPALTRAAQLMARNGKLDGARLLLREAKATNDADRAALKVAEAQVLHDANRHDEALALLQGALSANPEQPELIYETALAADRVGNFDQSEQLLRRLIQLKPEYAHAYNALGYSYADRNVKLDESQQLIDKALSLAPDDPFILDSKGWVLFRRGDLHGALDVLKQAYARRPDPEIAAHLGEVLWALGRKPDARKVWADAAKENPDNAMLAETIKKFQP